MQCNIWHANYLNQDQFTFNTSMSTNTLWLAPSVVALQRLLQACEDELCSLDMLINTKKSNCLRIGPRHDRVCVNITTENGCQLQWVDEIRYLGIFIVHSTIFKCSVNHAKRSFHRAANGIFGKIGRLASEKVIVQLLLHKWQII